jgi:uncharacterized radical SAM superfamily Fe-S cluster-containing enzyme
LIYEYEGSVYMSKTCSEHGLTKSLISSDSKLYEESFLYNFPGKLHLIRSHATEFSGNCPFDCGICPEHLQHTCAAMIEVTNRCNLNCPVCYMGANEGPDKTPSMEEIKKTLELLIRSETNPPALTITGGEPTLREDLVAIVKMAKAMGFADISLSTNGIIASKRPALLKELADSGLTEISISFDGLSDEVFMKMRGLPLLDTKIKAVDAALEAGLSVTVSAVIVNGVNRDQIGRIIDFAKKRHLDGVNFSPMAFVGRYPKEFFRLEERATIPEVLSEIEAQTRGELSAKDFVPVPCPDNRCSTMTYVFNDGEKLEPLTDYCDVRSYLDVYGEKVSCCDWVFAAIDKLWSMSAVPGSAKVVKNVGALSPKGHSTDDVMTISVHFFQDPWTLDVERVKKCCIHVAGPDKIVPLCAYNNLYRNRSDE